MSSPAPLTSRDQAIDTFLAQAGWADAVRRPLAGDASFRRYERVEGAKGIAVLMDAPPEKEDVRPYLYVAQQLEAQGYSAPHILAVDETQGLILLEDLGDALYGRSITAGASEETLYAAAVDLLAGWAKASAMPGLRPYDNVLLLQEVSLFSDWYLPQVLGKEKAAALRDEYLALWEVLLQSTPLETGCFVHRDYHANNLLWLPERTGSARVGLLDFQDAVMGDAAYDLVSLLEDARRDVDRQFADNMQARFVAQAGVDAVAFSQRYAVLGAQRNSKIIGIFTRLAVRDGKQHYLHLLPRVWAHLEHDVRHPSLAPLAAWLEQHILPAQRGVITIAP